MKTWLNWFAAWTAVAFQTAGREFDPELLLQPGGSVLAIGLWLLIRATMGKASAARLSARARKAAATAANLPKRTDDTGLQVIANSANCGTLRTCTPSGGTRS